MTPKYEKLLVSQHPFIFRGKDLSIRENLMPFGFECGDGWYTLINELATTIDRVLESDEELIKDFIITQVKEKYGTLRFYTWPTPDVIHYLTDFAESMSAHICESCGNPGETGGKGWIQTLCERCREMNKK